MKCPVCQKSVPDYAETCRWCGKDLSAQGSLRKRFVVLGFLICALASGLWLRNLSKPSSAVPPVQTRGSLLIQAPHAERDSVDSLVREANGYLMVKDCRGAIPLLQRVMKIRPDAMGWVLLAKCQIQEHQGKEALDALQAAQKMGSQDPNIASLLEKAQQLAREDQEMGQMESPHFHLWVEGKGNTWQASDTLLTALEKIYDELCMAWNYYPEQKIPAVLYESGRYRSDGMPDWSGALFDGKVRIPYNIMQNWPQNRRVLVHEVSHAFVHGLVGRQVSPWLDEGLAQHFDGTTLRLERLASTGPAPLTSLSQDFLASANADQAEQVYITSLGMLEILLRDGARGNLAEIKALLQGLREGVPLNELLSTRFNMTLEQIHSKFADQVSKSNSTQSP